MRRGPTFTRTIDTGTARLQPDIHLKPIQATPKRKKKLLLAVCFSAR